MEPAHAFIHMYTAQKISWGKQGNAVLSCLLIPWLRSFPLWLRQGTGQWKEPNSGGNRDTKETFFHRQGWGIRSCSMTQMVFWRYWIYLWVGTIQVSRGRNDECRIFLPIFTLVVWSYYALSYNCLFHLQNWLWFILWAKWLELVLQFKF